MTPSPRRVGILAGGGTLPLDSARAAGARGELARVVAIRDAADADYTGLPVTWLAMGQIQAILSEFRRSGATDLSIIGPVVRPDLLRVKKDIGFFRHLPRLLAILAAGGDDGVLGGVVRFFETQGFRVLAPADVAPGTLASLGPMTTAAPSPSDAIDIALGFDLVTSLGDLDIGQGAVISEGRVLAIEAADGTDTMLAILAASRREGAQPSGVLVKLPKPGQDLRVDMPSIGPRTVAGARAAGLRGIALKAGEVLIADREATLDPAGRLGVFVTGLEHIVQPMAHRTSLRSFTADAAGGRKLGTRDIADLVLAAETMKRLARFACGRAVAVSRRHVLAIEAGVETVDEMLDRVWVWRTKNGARPARREGVLLMDKQLSLENAVIAAAKRCGLTVIARLNETGGPLADEGVARALEAEGLILATVRAKQDARP